MHSPLFSLRLRAEAGAANECRPDKEATMRDFALSRRHLLQGSAAFAATGLAGVPALAKAPMLGTQAPYFYRFKFGNAEATSSPTARCRSAIRAPRSSG